METLLFLGNLGTGEVIIIAIVVSIVALPSILLVGLILFLIKKGQSKNN